MRRAFAERHGFDPLAGVDVSHFENAPDDASLDSFRGALVDGLARSGKRVFVLLPQIGAVRELRPWMTRPRAAQNVHAQAPQRWRAA